MLILQYNAFFKLEDSLIPSTLHKLTMQFCGEEMKITSVFRLKSDEESFVRRDSKNFEKKKNEIYV